MSTKGRTAARRVAPSGNRYVLLGDEYGTVQIPPALASGASSACDPLNPPHRRMVVSGEKGAIGVVDANLLTKEVAAEAAAYAKSVCPDGPYGDDGWDRNYARAYMEYLSRLGVFKSTNASADDLAKTQSQAPGITQSEDDRPSPPLQNGDAVLDDPPPPPPSPPLPFVDDRRDDQPRPAPPASLLGAFNGQARAAAPATGVAVGGAVATPSVRVRFDIPGPSASFEVVSDFHECHVARSNNAIIFGYDERYRGGSRFGVTQTTGCQFACQVDGQDVVHLIESPNIEFSVGPMTYYLYVIHQSAPSR